MLPFAPGIIGYYTEQDDKLSLELRSLRKPKTKTFIIKDSTIINTIKAGFSPILEDYLGDSLPGFSDIFFEMQSHPIPFKGEEREFSIMQSCPALIAGEEEEELDVINVKMKFCWIPAGKSILGSPESEVERHPDEEEHEFKTNGFWLAKYPVTQAQWSSVMSWNPSRHYFKGENLPVENVSWDDCQDFIKRCNVSGLKLQLPHEDQWEYACRGGKGNKQAFYWGDALSGDKANCDGTVPYGTDKKGAYLAKTSEVGSYEKLAPHPWNLCDMHGNVSEWCENLYTNYSYRVLRGGHWSIYPSECRSSYRGTGHPSYECSSAGFRLIIC